MLYFGICLVIVSSKYINSYLALTEENPWQPLTDFGMTIGTGNFTFRAKSANPTPGDNSLSKIQFSLYLANDWVPTLARQKCSEKSLDAIKSYDVLIPANGEWSEDIIGKLTQRRKPQVWYFVISDCKGDLKSSKIKVQLSVVNPGNEHFPAEMIGVNNVYWFILALLLVALGKNSYEFFFKIKSEGDVSGPLAWLIFSIIFHIIGVCFACIHYYFYSSDGEGLGVLEFFSELFLVLSSLAVSCLLIIIASGWTLVYKEFPSPEKFLPGMFLVLFCHLMTIAVDFVGEKTGFSKYEGWKGLIIIFINLLMFCWFLWNVWETNKNKALKNTGFFYLLGLAGTVFFLAVPLLVFGTYLFPLHRRELVMITGSHLVQTAIFYFLFLIFTGKGDYHKMNTVLNILPGSRSHIY
jgi:hypothetical protein